MGKIHTFLEDESAFQFRILLNTNVIYQITDGFGASLFSNSFNNSFYLLNTGCVAMYEYVVCEEGDYIIPILKKEREWGFREDK